MAAALAEKAPSALPTSSASATTRIVLITAPRHINPGEIEPALRTLPRLPKPTTASPPPATMRTALEIRQTASGEDPKEYGTKGNNAKATTTRLLMIRPRRRAACTTGESRLERRPRMLMRLAKPAEGNATTPLARRGLAVRTLCAISPPHGL